ncbi:HNH/endonuclease VII fold putative polymorphic toxin, partial [Pseudoduganella plicata]
DVVKSHCSGSADPLCALRLKREVEKVLEANPGAYIVGVKTGIGADPNVRQTKNPGAASNSTNTTASGKASHTVWEDAKEAFLINDIQRVYVTAKKLATDTVNYIGGDDKGKEAAGASFRKNWQEYVGLGMMLVTRGRASEGALAKGARAPNMTPAGAGRAGAFNAAKREAGIPTSQQPSRTLPNEDLRGNPQPGRIYEFEVPAPGGGTRTVRIRDDAGGHNYGPGDPQNRGSHFNDPAKNHYDYDH